MKKTEPYKVIIGRSEPVTFVGFEGLDNLPAKIDTGAYHSAVHASNIALLKGGKILQFDLLGGHPVYGSLAGTSSTKDFRTVVVTNSFGVSQERFEVKLRVKIGPKIFESRFSLSDRSKMTFPVLIGRQTLSNRFLVDSRGGKVDRSELKSKYTASAPGQVSDISRIEDHII